MRRWWFSIHKWVGLVIGLQVLAWMVSGFYMTLVPIEQVRSEHMIRKTEALDLRAHAKPPFRPQPCSRCQAVSPGSSLAKCWARRFGA